MGIKLAKISAVATSWCFYERACPVFHAPCQVSGRLVSGANQLSLPSSSAVRFNQNHFGASPSGSLPTRRMRRRAMVCAERTLLAGKWLIGAINMDGHRKPCRPGCNAWVTTSAGKWWAKSNWGCAGWRTTGWSGFKRFSACPSASFSRQKSGWRIKSWLNVHLRHRLTGRRNLAADAQS